MRPDEVIEIDARYTLETSDGALIYVSNPGVRTGSPDAMELLARGETCDQRAYYFRTRPVFETAAPKYGRLNRIIAVATGERLAREVIITAHEVT